MYLVWNLHIIWIALNSGKNPNMYETNTHEIETALKMHA